jgi:hypothetical protein
MEEPGALPVKTIIEAGQQAGLYKSGEALGDFRGAEHQSVFFCARR